MAWLGLAHGLRPGHRAVHHTVYGVRPYNYSTTMVMGLLYTITIIFFFEPQWHSMAVGTAVNSFIQYMGHKFVFFPH